MVLAPLEPPWVLALSLVGCGLVFFGDLAAATGPRQHSIVTFVLNVISLPVGGWTLLVGVLDALQSGHLGLGPIAGIVVGALLAGRSLREVPWTGALSLAVGVGAGAYLVRYAPWPLPLWEILAASGVVFVVVYVALYLIELPLRLVGLFALPRPFLAVLGAAAFGLAALVAFGGPV